MPSPRGRGHFALDELYACRPEPPLDLPIRVLRDHFFVDAHRAAIAELLASTLSYERRATP